nr:DUF3016 domain-containing protein [Shewanella gelidii]
MLAGATFAGEQADKQKNPMTEHGLVTIEWQAPESYRDIEASSGKQERYEQRVFETLTKSLDKEASKFMQEHQKLYLVVTDVDLAGDVRPTFGATTNDIRVVKDIYPPRMTFSYQVVDNDQVVIAGNEKLSDLGFTSASRRNQNEPLRYEIKMLNDWLNKSLKPML